MDERLEKMLDVWLDGEERERRKVEEEMKRIEEEDRERLEIERILKRD